MYRKEDLICIEIKFIAPQTLIDIVEIWLNFMNKWLNYDLASSIATDQDQKNCVEEVL